MIQPFFGTMLTVNLKFSSFALIEVFIVENSIFTVFSYLSSLPAIILFKSIFFLTFHIVLLKQQAICYALLT
jgi:hypothetical protein